MTITKERPTADVERASGTAVVEKGRTPEVEEATHRETPPSELRFGWWLAWLAGVVLVLGVAAVVWLASPSGPAMEDLDPHINPEIMRNQVVTLAPQIQDIDLHDSPELLSYVIVGPQMEEIDPHESPEILRGR